jgi:hypothetical protein
MKTLKDLTLSDIVSVYVGKSHRCCCGCSGLHSYNPGNRVEAEVSEDQCNLRTVQRVLKLVKDRSVQAEGYLNHYSYETASRLYIVYLTLEAQAVQPS